MSEDQNPPRICFGPFELNPQSGELRDNSEPEPSVSRLPPQPTRLLAHLIERQPELVTREEIKDLLWPDTAVEFEESLHSCVRKIRVALGDSASNPGYIETVPRRGYRFVGPRPTRLQNGFAAAAARNKSGISMRAVVLATMLAVVAVAVVTLTDLWPDPTTSKNRIAVMPFEPATGSSNWPADNDIAESLVDLLVNGSTDPPDVVGPTTTEAYDQPQRLRALVAEFDIDFIVNARESFDESGLRVLVEIIRASDGAHVWVRFLDQLPADGVPESIAAALKDSIESP